MNIHQKQLRIIGHSVYLNASEKTINCLRDLCLEGKLDVISTDYRDTWRRPAAFTEEGALVSYEGCYYVELGQDDIVTVTIFNGEPLYGNRRDIRAIFKLSGEWWLCEPLTIMVQSAFTKAASDRLADEEERERVRRRRDIENKMLSEFDDAMGEVEGQNLLAEQRERRKSRRA